MCCLIKLKIIDILLFSGDCKMYEKHMKIKFPNNLDIIYDIN